MEKIDSGKIKLSIIIPYFETFELTMKLLRELSLQRNNNEEVEIILVDDGCKNEFAKIEVATDDILNKGRITVITHEKNEGVSKSRNDGIKIAKGKYIAFIDSDDMITMDYIERLLNIIEEHNEDIIYFNWADFNENAIIRHPQNYAVWKAIYKKEIVPKFDVEKRFNEDVFFQEELEKKPLSKYYMDRVLYIYNSNREGSQMWRRDRQ